MRCILHPAWVAALATVLAPAAAGIGSPVGAEVCREVAISRELSPEVCLGGDLAVNPGEPPHHPQTTIDATIPPNPTGFQEVGASLGADAGMASAMVTVRVRPGSL